MTADGVRDPAAEGPIAVEALLDAVPVGLCVYDADQRFVMANSAYYDVIGLPPDTLRPGSTLTDNIRMLQLRGIFGAADPDRQVDSILQHDYRTVMHARRQQPNGRSFDATYSPVAGGGHVVSVVEQTATLALRDQAESAVERLHMAISGLRVGLAIFGGDRRLVLHNARFRELLGLPPDSVRPGTAFADVLQTVQERGTYSGSNDGLFVAGQLAADRSRPASVRQLRPGGQVIDIQSDPLPDGGWTLAVSDITALAHAEDEARRRAGMLDNLVQRIPHGILVYGPDMRVMMINTAYRNIMVGAPVEVGERREDIVLRQSAQGEYGPGDPMEIYARQLSFDIARPTMRRRQRPNGTTIDVRTAPLPDGGYTSVITDVTSLIEAEAELGRRAKTMDAMLANIRHGIILWNREKRIVAFNAVAEQMILAPPGLLTPGRTLEDLIKSAFDRGNLGVGQAALDSMARLRSLDRSQSHQDQRLTRTGRVLEVRTDPTPDGGFVTTYTDVTSIRQAEEALHKARRSAESANAAKSRFLAAMSHELRTPLSAVITSAETIMRAADHADGAPVLAAAETAHVAGRQLLSMLDTILDVARLEAGRFDLAHDQVDLSRLVRACVRQSDAAAAAAEVLLEVELPAGLPVIRGDERRLRQALHHLVTNAVKFTGAGGQARITAHYDPSADLLLTVSDTGIGIAEADLDRVFQPFAQFDTPLHERFPGTGLGLYISRALMRAHGGELLLRSRPGEGTTATMRIPVERLLSAASETSVDRSELPA
ncbi:MAG: PAS-domain containing protein [Gemmatimonadaceae bacterium]|nr:PAS-domain containing protein [Acetobacteraceae bacterium]